MAQAVIVSEGIAGGVAGSGSDTVVNPAAGAQWTWTVPSGYLVSFTSVLFEYDTSATVATRLVRLQVKDYNNRLIMDTFPNATEPASSAFLYRFMAAVENSYVINVNRVIAPLDNSWHSPGTILTTSVDNGQTGDTFLGITLFYNTRLIETATTGDTYDQGGTLPLQLGSGPIQPTGTLTGGPK